MSEEVFILASLLIKDICVDYTTIIFPQYFEDINTLFSKIYCFDEESIISQITFSYKYFLFSLW